MSEQAIELIRKEKEIKSKSLDLSNLDLVNIPIELFELTWLQELNLRGNYLSDISNLNKLENLEFLDLSGNEIENFEVISQFRRLNNIKLRGCRIKEKTLKNGLNELREIDLSLTRLNNYEFIQNFSQLKKLNLSINFISDISWIESLINLEELNLMGNEIIDIKSLQKLNRLKFLDLSHNQISHIHYLNNLTHLPNINLSYNLINNLIGILPILRRGKTIGLDANGSEDINISNNPIETPPIKIILEGNSATINWLEQVKNQGTENLFEARIIIVGEPGAGKTTLFRKLTYENTIVPDINQESTHGININNNRMFNHSNKKNIQIKTTIWDFGGQDIQTYLHQYFYAEDNLFLLVCDQRSERNYFDYWLEMIARLSGNCRVIIIRNNKERKSASQSLNLDKYQKIFDKLELSYIDIDFKEKGIKWISLVDTIEDNLSQMKRVNELVPRTWKPIRESILNLKINKKPYIDLDDFLFICSKEGLTKEDDQELCIKYLHRLGIALNYRDSTLNNTVFIDPEWITKGLYEVLKENCNNKIKGRFSEKELFKLWRNIGINKMDERNLLLNLLLKDKFEVCYKIENSNEYLVPMLVTNDKKEPLINKIDPYILRFKFPFMPFGFFSRLIVRLYDKIWDDYVWLTGVWLKDQNNCRARMEHFKDVNTGEEVFEISIYGQKKERKELLAEIRAEILHIRKQLFSNLIIEEQIPCFCEVCSNQKTPYFHKKNIIENFIYNRNIETSQCGKSGEPISIYELLDSVINIEHTKREDKTMGKEGINIDFNPHIEFKPKINQVQETKVKALAKAKASAENEVTITINNILGEVQNLKEDFEDEKKLLLKTIDEDEYNVVYKQIEKAEQTIHEIESSIKVGKPLPVKAKSRLAQFINNLTDEKTTLGKSVKLLVNGVDFASKLVGLYSQLPIN